MTGIVGNYLFVCARRVKKIINEAVPGAYTYR